MSRPSMPEPPRWPLVLGAIVLGFVIVMFVIAAAGWTG